MLDQLQVEAGKLDKKLGTEPNMVPSKPTALQMEKTYQRSTNEERYDVARNATSFLSRSTATSAGWQNQNYKIMLTTSIIIFTTTFRVNSSICNSSIGHKGKIAMAIHTTAIQLKKCKRKIF